MKRHLKKLVSAIAIIVGLSLLVSVPEISAIDSPDYTRGAHRGASIAFEENTLDAFRSAAEDPLFEFIEFDIQLTADGKKAVIHQNNIFRIPKKFAKISTMNYSEVHETFEFYVPTYEEVIDIVKEKPLQIDIKSSKNLTNDQELIDFLVSDLEEAGVEDYIISSTSEDIVKYTEETYPHVETGRVFWVTQNSIFPTGNAVAKFYNSTAADYVFIHGHNLRNYDLLMENKPEDVKIAFWYFTDEIYLMS